MTDQQILRLSKAFFALCLLFYVAYAAQLAAKNVLYFDDAYMYLRYAQNLLSDGVYGWNTDRPTFGCISVPYTFWVTGLKAAGLERLGQGAMLILASSFWGLVAIGSALRLGLFCVEKKAGDLPRALVWLLVGLVAVNPLFIKNTTIGMETSLSMCANLWLVNAAFAAQKRGFYARGIFVLVFSGYFAYLVRPDNGIYATLFPVLFLWANSAGLRKTIGFCAGLSALLAIDLALKWCYFGNPLPLPFYHKSGKVGGYLLPEQFEPCRNLFFFLALLGWPFWVALFTVRRADWRVATAFLGPLGLTFAFYFTITQIMGFDSRYYFPSTAFVLAPVFLLLKNPPAVSMRRLMAGVLLTGTLMASSFFLTKILRDKRQVVLKTVSDEELFNAMEVSMRVQILENGSSVQKLHEILQKLPKGTVIAAGEHGQMAARNPHIHIIDVFGLHNPEVALGGGWNDGVLEREKPVLVWLTHFDNIGLNRLIRAGEHFKRDYAWYPNCVNFGVAVRRDSPYFGMISKKLEGIGCAADSTGRN